MNVQTLTEQHAVFSWDIIECIFDKVIKCNTSSIKIVSQKSKSMDVAKV